MKMYTVVKTRKTTMQPLQSFLTMAQAQECIGTHLSLEPHDIHRSYFIMEINLNRDFQEALKNKLLGLDDDSVSLETPRGGQGLWVLHICKDDDIIGFLKVTDEASLRDFREAFKPLYEKKWGTMLLEVDTGAK